MTTIQDRIAQLPPYSDDHCTCSICDKDKVAIMARLVLAEEVIGRLVKVWDTREDDIDGNTLEECMAIESAAIALLPRLKVTP